MVSPSDAQIPQELLDLAAEAAEPLLPELEPYVCEGPFGPGSKMLKHPLVFEMFLSTPGLVNKRYLAKKAGVEAAAAADDWPAYVFLHERPHRFEALMFARDFGTCPEPDFWELAADVWVDSENIWQHADDWYDLFEAASADDRAAMMSTEERAALAAMPESITVWRGCEREVNEDGLSWTLDRSRAEWFARRFKRDGDAPLLIEGRLDRADVVAYFTARGEDEIIALPEEVAIISYSDMADDS